MTRLAALPIRIAKVPLSILAMAALAVPVIGWGSFVQAEQTDNITVAMRVAPSAPANVTVVPKSSNTEVDLETIERAAARHPVQDTVRAQLKALAKGDADIAFANLSPQTQRYFAEPQHFMTSVATKAPPIVKTKSFAFVGLHQEAGQALQQVLLTDEEGRTWLANFEVERQLGGDWRVKSCVVEAVPGQQA